MSYNIRYDNPADGVNHWPKRSEKVFALIKKYDPVLLGLQEALKHQIDDITRAIPNYKYAGVGRDDGKEKGEYSPILYQPSKVDLLQSGTQWLSEQPEMPGSKSWDAAITRIVTWALFKDKISGKEFYYLNTHFDHIGKDARKNSAALIIKLTKELQSKKNIPVLVTGDFNAQPTEPPYTVMMESKLFTDSRKNADVGTACTFSVNGRCNLIDYIFHTNGFTSSAYQVIKDNDGTNYPSDHLPVMAELRLGK
jgi:endonuclease/exonuclease/phosphatase family metal-dependent hydrolase